MTMERLRMTMEESCHSEEQFPPLCHSEEQFPRSVILRSSFPPLCHSEEQISPSLSF